jgi:hypothetical protein
MLGEILTGGREREKKKLQRSKPGDYCVFDYMIKTKMVVKKLISELHRPDMCCWLCIIKITAIS